MDSNGFKFQQMDYPRIARPSIVLFSEGIMNNPLNCTESNIILHTIRIAAIPKTLTKISIAKQNKILGEPGIKLTAINNHSLNKIK